MAFVDNGCHRTKVSRCIVKASQCLIKNRECQELLAKSQYRYLMKMLSKKTRFVTFLQLADVHQADGNIPPGLRIKIHPPGFSQITDDLSDWYRAISFCSDSLLDLLRQKYVKEIKECERCVKHSMKQLISIICSLRDISRSDAENDVAELLRRISYECTTELMRRFDKISLEYRRDVNNEMIKAAKSNTDVKSHMREKSREKLDHNSESKVLRNDVCLQENLFRGCCKYCHCPIPQIDR